MIAQLNLLLPTMQAYLYICEAVALTCTRVRLPVHAKSAVLVVLTRTSDARSL
jgi:hypothetical protein